MTKIKVIIALGVAFCILIASGYIYYLNSKNESLEASIKQKQIEIDTLIQKVEQGEKALNIINENQISKDELQKTIDSIKREIKKDKNDEIINQPLRDSVNFIIARLREQENAK
ncbi:MAG: hypothetical protein IJT33_03530 [Campylobacter sp.]|nr:hypothetical protein [Campylobacter sp.]